MDLDSLPIKTQRLLLTPVEKTHYDAYLELSAHPETHRYNYSSPKTAEEAEKHIRYYSEYDYQNPKDRMELSVIEKETGKYIGYCGLKYCDYKSDGTGEIFYTLHPDVFGRGLGTELVQGLLSFSFTVIRLHRIWAGATVENAASWKIMAKNGMRRECHWVKDRPKPGDWIPGKGYVGTGEWEDGYGYAITREEWEALNR